MKVGTDAWASAPRGVSLFTRAVNVDEEEDSSSVTLGTKTRQRVPVVQKTIKIDMMTYETSCSSSRMKETAPPITHMITTLYTLIPNNKQYHNKQSERADVVVTVATRTTSGCQLTSTSKTSSLHITNLFERRNEIVSNMETRKTTSETSRRQYNKGKASRITKRAATTTANSIIIRRREHTRTFEITFGIRKKKKIRQRMS